MLNRFAYSQKDTAASAGGDINHEHTVPLGRRWRLRSVVALDAGTAVDVTVSVSHGAMGVVYQGTAVTLDGENVKTVFPCGDYANEILLDAGDIVVVTFASTVENDMLQSSIIVQEEPSIIPLPS